VIVRAKARTYLRGKGKAKEEATARAKESKDEGKEEARARVREEADPAR
jgi:hypothetical protein